MPVNDDGTAPDPTPRARASRAVVVAVVAAVLMPALVGGPAATVAHAAAPREGAGAGRRADPPRLMLSADGLRWQVRLTAGPTAAGEALVPGGTTSTTFWVKNVTSDPAVLRARVVDVEVSSPAFARDLTVTATRGAETSADPTPSLPLGSPACTALRAPGLLSAGEEAPVTVALALAESATGSSAGQSVGVTVLVSLAGRAGDAADECPSPAVPGAAMLRGGERDVAGDADVRSADGVVASSTGPVAAGAASGETSPRFVGLPLPGERLPLLLGAVSLLAGGFVALGRRRPEAHADASADPGSTAAASRDATDRTGA